MDENEILDIVNEKDEIIGQVERDRVEKSGYLWRAAHVWFVTPQGEVIFQIRSMTKETHPGMWDATVSGHVASGDDYISTALREAKEETGMEIHKNDLVSLGKITPVKVGDRFVTTAFRKMFMYFYRGKIEDLKLEPRQGDGFVKMKIEDILKLDPKSEIGRKIVPDILKKPSLDILQKSLEYVNIYNYWCIR